MLPSASTTCGHPPHSPASQELKGVYSQLWSSARTAKPEEKASVRALLHAPALPQQVGEHCPSASGSEHPQPRDLCEPPPDPWWLQQRGGSCGLFLCLRPAAYASHFLYTYPTVLPRPPTIPFMETELVSEGTTSLGLCGRSSGTIEQPAEF